MYTYIYVSYRSHGDFLLECLRLLMCRLADGRIHHENNLRQDGNRWMGIRNSLGRLSDGRIHHENNLRQDGNR